MGIIKQLKKSSVSLKNERKRHGMQRRKKADAEIE